MCPRLEAQAAFADDVIFFLFFYFSMSFLLDYSIDRAK